MTPDAVRSQFTMFLFATADAIDRDGATLDEAKELLRTWLTDDPSVQYPQWVWDLVGEFEALTDEMEFSSAVRDAGLQLLGHQPPADE